MQKKIENIILFQNKIHLVFEDNISLNIYAKINHPEEIFECKNLVLDRFELIYPLINFYFNKNHSIQTIQIDLTQTYKGDFVRLELNAPKKYSLIEPGWTKGNDTEKSYVLFI